MNNIPGWIMPIYVFVFVFLAVFGPSYAGRYLAWKHKRRDEAIFTSIRDHIFKDVTAEIQPDRKTVIYGPPAIYGDVLEYGNPERVIRRPFKTPHARRK